MALKLNERYPGRFDNPTTAYPQGAFKNRSAPGAQDGSYLEKDWANDAWGLFGRLLTVAGIAPNGNADTALASQYYDALNTIFAAKSTLGNSSTRNVGTTAGTVAAGDDSRIINAIQPTSNRIITARVNFSVSGGVVTINDAYNISSVVRTATGRFTINFTNPMSNVFYCPTLISRRPTGSTSEDGICYGLGSTVRPMNTNQFPISINNAASTAEDPLVCCINVFGGV